MAGVITVVPDETLQTAGWSNVGGAATYQAALSDASDTTYVTDTTQATTDTFLEVGLSPVTLPDGAAVKSVVPKVRASLVTGVKKLEGWVYRDGGQLGRTIYESPASQFQPGTTIKDYVLAAAGELNQKGDGYLDDATTQDIINQLTFKLRLAGGGRANDDHRVYRMSADVNYIDAPLASAVALVDVNDVTKTTKPRFRWTYSSDDGLPQYAYRTIVWALADINLFTGGRAAFEADPKNIWGNDTGDTNFSGATFTGTDGLSKTPKAWNLDPEYGTYMSAWSPSPDAAWTPTQDLAGTGTYVLYVQVAALFAGNVLARKVGAASYATFDFTMNLTPPAAPSAITGVWQYPKAAAPNNVTKYATKVTVTVPAQALAGFAGRRVQVEHRLSPTGSPAPSDQTWRILPVGTQEAGTNAGTFTFYDTLVPPGAKMEYRARAILYDATYQLPGAYTTLGSVVTAVFDAFVLRDPLDAQGGATVLLLEGDFTYSESEAMGAFRALGADRPTFVSDRLTGKTFPLRARLPDQPQANTFDAIRDARKTLLLQTDMEGTWYWVRFLEDVETTIVRQINRKASLKRNQYRDFQLAETYPVSGQPASWF